MGSSDALLFPSMWSPWWWRSPALKYGIPWIQIHLGRWECPCVSPEWGRFDTVPWSPVDLLHHVQCSGAGSGGSFGRGLWWAMTPLCCPSHGCPLDVAVLGEGAPQLSWCAQQRMGTHWPEAVPHTQTLSSSPLWCRVCVSLAADKPGAVASTLKQVLGWAMGGLPDALNNSVTLLISTCPMGLTQSLGFQEAHPGRALGVQFHYALFLSGAKVLHKDFKGINHNTSVSDMGHVLSCHTPWVLTVYTGRANLQVRKDCWSGQRLSGQGVLPLIRWPLPCWCSDGAAHCCAHDWSW